MSQRYVVGNTITGTSLLSVTIRASYEPPSNQKALAFQDPVAQRWTFVISFNHRTGAFNSNIAPWSTRAHAFVSLVFTKTGGQHHLNKVTSNEKKGLRYTHHSVLNGSLVELCISTMQAEFNHQPACKMEEIIYQYRYKLVREWFPIFLHGAQT